MVWKSLAISTLLITFGTQTRADDSIDSYLEEGARLLVVSAHPDDETLFGPILTHACIDLVLPCHFAVMTTGEGGDCSLKNGCPDGLGVTRIGEMNRVADRYGASVSWAGFRNFPHTGTREASWYDLIRQDWAEVTHPVDWVRAQINWFRPDLVLTVDPDHGFYGHAEHILTGRLVLEALGLRTDARATGWALLEHQPTSLYTILNHYWVFRPVVGRDPGEATETWPAHRRCAGGRSCMEVAVDIASLHASQQKSGIGFFQFAGKFIKNLYLKQVKLR